MKLTIATVRRLMEEEPRYRAVLKKQVKAADGTIDISWINEDLITFVKDRLGHDQRYAIDPTKITNALAGIRRRSSRSASSRPLNGT